MKFPVGGMTKLHGFAVLALTVVIWLCFERHQMHRRVEAAFRGRTRLSVDEFFATYYQESVVPKEIVNGVLQVLGDELPVDISRVIPEDSFAGNLHFLLNSDSMIDVAIVERLEKHFGITISDQEAEHSCTVHDIIKIVQEKTLSE